jgi:hypothetical protein
MTPKCVCGHHSFIHFASAGMCFETCGCECFQADDGTEPLPIHPKTQVYDGFYANKKWPPPSQETA